MAIQLNASDIHLTSPLINFADRNAPCSVCGWVNSAVWNTNNTVASMFGVYLNGVTGIQIGTRGSARQLDFWIWGGSVYLSSIGFNPPDNTWFHVGYTYDGTTHSIYINGVLNNTSVYTSTSGVMNQVYVNGYPSGGNAETSKTQIDDILYYNRCLLPAEVQTIAEGKGFRDGIYYDLFARYCFNELPPGNTVVSVADYSSGGGTLSSTGTGAPITYVAGVIDLDERPVLG